ncbi:MAG: N-acetylmuramoyl-L-alanine amidase [Myxococcales bacterium]|nr:N-acetylmuramoyl-L-alanine amidase [Myxococcales bacterium]
MTIRSPVPIAACSVLLIALPATGLALPPVLRPATVASVQAAAPFLARAFALTHVAERRFEDGTATVDRTDDPAFPVPAVLHRVRRLVLDPGHGGDNLGALGVAGIREKALTLTVSRRIAAFVRGHSNLDVVLTRETDCAVALRDRPRLANERAGDALISVHANAHPEGEAHGMEVFFLASDSSAETARALIEAEEGTLPADTGTMPWTVDAIVSDLSLAAAHARSEALAGAMARSLQVARPEARFRGVRQAPFGVLKEAQMPAIVFELGYITHADEAQVLMRPTTHVAFARAVLAALVELDRQWEAEAAPERRPAGPGTLALPRR